MTKYKVNYTDRQTGNIEEGRQQVEAEPSEFGKDRDVEMMLALGNILTQLQIMNKYLGDITGDEKTKDDLI